MPPEEVTRVDSRRLLPMTTVMVVVACFLLPRPAHAYVDPGTGSQVLQLLIGGVLAAWFILGNGWQKLKGLVAERVFRRPPPSGGHG